MSENGLYTSATNHAVSVLDACGLLTVPPLLAVMQPRMLEVSVGKGRQVTTTAQYV